MQFKLPKQLNVLGITYDVEVLEDDFIVDKTVAIGSSCHNEKKIHIKRYENPQTMLEILFHEVLHMIQDSVNEEKTIPHLTESQINLMAVGLTTTILNSPSLFDVVPLDEDLED